MQKSLPQGILQEYLFLFQNVASAQLVSPVKAFHTGACGSDSAVFFENYGVKKNM